jgi:phage-related protein
MAKKQFEVALVLTAADKASRIINELTRNAQMRIQGMSKMGDQAFGVGRTAGATGLALAGALALPLKAAADMESMNVSLRTSFQGNEKAATDAFNKINKFAAATPYGLEEVMTGFIKLKNMGLDPSTEALTAYGNTASAMGKSLNDMVEAVADAATGEFERLKEFGIKASSEGDKVSFMFQGVKTTVGKNSQEIEQYLKYIGNVKFAGGIEAQSKTLNGMMSTLRDGVIMSASKIGTTLLPQVKELMNRITPLIDRISAWVERNPELTATILKITAAAAALSLTVSVLAFTFGGVFKAISAVMWISKTYRLMVISLKAAQMAYTFSLLAGTGGVEAMRAAMTALNLAFLMNPITWVVLAIVGLIAAGYALIKNWDKVKAFFIGLWDYVTGVFHRAMEVINKTFLRYSPVMLIYNNWNKITGFFSGLWEKVKYIFATMLLWVWKWISPFFKLGSAIIDGVWNGIKSKVEPLYNFVKGVGKKIADTFKYVLGIASPSKVFMDYGVNITEGAKKGMEKGTPALQSASRGMGLGIKPASGSRSGSGGGGGITVNFAPVISGGGNGQDIAQQLKALIPQLVREIESAMQRKQRLSY